MESTNLTADELASMPITPIKDVVHHSIKGVLTQWKNDDGDGFTLVVQGEHDTLDAFRTWVGDVPLRITGSGGWVVGEFTYDIVIDRRAELVK